MMEALPIPIIAEINKLTQRLLAGETQHHHFLQKQYWDARSNDWNLYESPFRPSELEIAQYRSLLATTENKRKILLLGSTPELRKLLSEHYYHSSIFICDFSWRMLEAMTYQADSVDPEKEIWVKADWNEPALPVHFFDLVIGDLPLLQIHPERELQFLKQIYRLLLPNGICIMRCRLRNGKSVAPQKIIETAIKKFEKDPLEKNARHLLWELFDVSAEKETRLINYTYIFDSINTYKHKYGDHAILARVIEKLEKCQADFPFRWKWACADKNDFMRIASKYFNIQELPTTSTKDQTAEYIILAFRAKTLPFITTEGHL